MTLPVSGPLSLANIQTEFGGAAPISLSEYYAAAAGIPGSGPISISQFHGKSSVPPIPSFVAAIGSNSPYVYAWPWAGGLGTQYSSPTLPSSGASSSPSQTANKMRVVSGGVPAVISAHTATPFVNAWAWSSGWGSKYGNPGTLPPGGAYNIKQNGGGPVFLGHTGSPYISAYQWSPGFGTKYTGVATGITSTSHATVSPDGATVTGGDFGPPGIHAWAWSVAGFGAKYGNPSSTIAAFVYDSGFNPSGTVLAVANNAADKLSAYPWSSGFGTKYANPVTPLSTDQRHVSFHPNGATVMSGAPSGSPYVNAYAFSSGFGSKYADPVTSPNSCYSATWSPDGNSVAIGAALGEIAKVYQWNPGFGTKYASSISITEIAYGIGWSY